MTRFIEVEGIATAVDVVLVTFNFGFGPVTLPRWLVLGHVGEGWIKTWKISREVSHLFR